MANGETTTAVAKEEVQGQPAPAAKWKGRTREAFKWLTLAVVGFLLGDAYSAARDWAMDKPDYLQELAKTQKQEFADLRDSLQKIGGTIDNGDRAAFNQVKGAIKSIEQTNASLIQQLVMAKQENETLRTVAGQQAGISGGYDFILSETRGIRIDPATVLGVETVHGGGVWVNLTSGTAEKPLRMHLDPGQFVPYSNARGGACKLSLLSYNNGDPGTATFSNHCA